MSNKELARLHDAIELAKQGKRVRSLTTLKDLGVGFQDAIKMINALAPKKEV